MSLEHDKKVADREAKEATAREAREARALEEKNREGQQTPEEENVAK